MGIYRPLSDQFCDDWYWNDEDKSDAVINNHFLHSSSIKTLFTHWTIAHFRLFCTATKVKSHNFTMSGAMELLVCEVRSQSTFTQTDTIGRWVITHWHITVFDIVAHLGSHQGSFVWDKHDDRLDNQDRLSSFWFVCELDWWKWIWMGTPDLEF